MSRLLAIAQREYLAYVRTVGFWLSICLLPVGIIVAILAPSMIARHNPPATVMVIDQTGRSFAPRLAHLLSESGGDSERIDLVQPPETMGEDPVTAAARLKPYLADRSLPDGRALDAGAILHDQDGRVSMDLWTRNPSESVLRARLAGAVGELSRRDRLKSAGLDAAALAAIENADPDVESFSPEAAHGRIDLRDQLPGLIGLGMGLLLWMVTLTGAQILLGSVIEEKSSKILEVLLSSASVPEIMGGKILGVAAVTSTVLGVWITIGLGLLGATHPQIIGDVLAALLTHGLLFYFAFYFVAGYLMYATLFVTIGAFCETAREAQTLLGPMMILLSVPLVFFSQSISHPNSPIMTALSWAPPFTPFLMVARAASQPPLAQVVGTGLLLILVTGLELMVAGRAFRAGALSSGKLDVRLLFASLAGRGPR